MCRNAALRTVVGDDGFFMAGAHAAHDCVVGDHVVLCNNVLLAGHVQVGDRAFLAGASAVGGRRGGGSAIGSMGLCGLEGAASSGPGAGLGAGLRTPVKWSAVGGLSAVGGRRQTSAPPASYPGG